MRALAAGAFLFSSAPSSPSPSSPSPSSPSPPSPSPSSPASPSDSSGLTHLPHSTTLLPWGYVSNSSPPLPQFWHLRGFRLSHTGGFISAKKNSPFLPKRTYHLPSLTIVPTFLVGLSDSNVVAESTKISPPTSIVPSIHLTFLFQVVKLVKLVVTTQTALAFCLSVLSNRTHFFRIFASCSKEKT